MGRHAVGDRDNLAWWSIATQHDSEYDRPISRVNIWCALGLWIPAEDAAGMASLLGIVVVS